MAPAAISAQKPTYSSSHPNPLRVYRMRRAKPYQPRGKAPRMIALGICQGMLDRCANRLQPPVVSNPFAQPMRIGDGTDKRRIRRNGGSGRDFSRLPAPWHRGCKEFTPWDGPAGRRGPRQRRARRMKHAIQQSRPPMPFAEEALTPGACFSDGLMLPEMVVVPPGKFWMGADQENRHWVQIAYPLAISRYPITFEQWDAYAVGDPDVHLPDDCGGGRGRRSVVNVSWEDAEHYVSWLSIAAGRAYRLLSEAEWEYYCRCSQPLPVGSIGPNAFGLFAMDGNFRELLADAWHESYREAPTDGSAWEQNEATMWRVVRGPARDRIDHIKRMNDTGFRVACGLD